MMFLYYIAFFILAAAYVLWRARDEAEQQRREHAQLCPCFTVWKSLDTRWMLLRGACDAIVHTLSWSTVSAAYAALGGVIGWFLGATHVRIPLDELYFDRIVRDHSDFGCIQGARALVEVHHLDNLYAPPEKWCPTKARMVCSTDYWVDTGAPQRD